MAEPFVCVLCKAGGQPTLAPRWRRSVICEDHADALAVQGRAWCYRGAHVVRVEDMANMRAPWCTSCEQVYRSDYYQRNREARKAYQRQRYLADPKAAYERARQWRERNPERYRKQHASALRAWRRRNPERVRDAWARYAARYPQKVQAYRSEYRLRRKLRVLRQIRRAA